MDFVTMVLIIIQTIAIIWGGMYLKKELHLKETQIDVLTKNFAATKELLSLYNVDEFRKNLNLRIENITLEHEKERKALMEKLMMKFSPENKEFTDAFFKLSEDWIYKYNELLSLTANILIPMSDEQQNWYLKNLPLNGEFIKECLTNIKNGKVKPT